MKLPDEINQSFLEDSDKDAMFQFVARLDPKRRKKFLERVKKIDDAYHVREEKKDL